MKNTNIHTHIYITRYNARLLVALQVWDVLGGRGGRLLHTLANHQKTVTCLALDGTGTRLLSGGLDRHVKIYNLENFKVGDENRYLAWWNCFILNGIGAFWCQWCN